MTRRRGARPLRVVLDTNVLVSALLFGRGPTAELRRAWQSRLVVPLVSAQTSAELVRVMAYPKFHLDAADRDELIADYLPYADVVRIPVPPPAVPPCRDPFDVPFLHLAIAGRATALVSGDADLLAIGTLGRCRIESPAVFAERLRE